MENQENTVKADMNEADTFRPEANKGQTSTVEMGQNRGVDINQTTAVNCVQCGGEFFKQSTLLRRVPANLTENGQEQVVPVQLLRCEVCGRVV